MVETMTKHWPLVLAALLGAFGFLVLAAPVHAQYTKVVRPVDIRFGQRTVAVADTNNRTLTLVGGEADMWVCAPHDGGKSCLPVGSVVAHILQEGTGE